MNLKDKKRTIVKLLNKLEDEALDKGIDITSDRFQELAEKLKAKLIQGQGLTIEQYREIGKDKIKEQIEKERIDHSKEIEELKQTNQEVKEKVLIQTEKIKGLELLSDQQKDNFKMRLSSLKDELENTKDISLERKVLIQEELIGLNDKLDTFSKEREETSQKIEQFSKEQTEKQEKFNNENNLKHKEQEEDINFLAKTVNKLWIKE